MIFLLEGDKYIGEWKDDKFEGKGIFYCNNGSKYNGEFKDNKLEGMSKKHIKKENEVKLKNHFHINKIFL